MQLPHPHTFNIVLQTFDKSNLKEGVWQCAQLVDNLLASWFKRQREKMLQIVKKKNTVFYFASRGLWHVRTLFGQSGLGDQTKSKAEVCLES